jgi:hypothetical protein
MNRCGTSSLCSDGGLLRSDNVLLQCENICRAPNLALQKQKEGGIREPIGS